MHEYHDHSGSFPPGAKGCCWGTWILFILPTLSKRICITPGISSATIATIRPFKRGMFRYAWSGQQHRDLEPDRNLLLPVRPVHRQTRAGVGGVTSQNYVVNFGNTISNQTPFYSVQRGERSRSSVPRSPTWVPPSPTSLRRTPASRRPAAPSIFQASADGLSSYDAHVGGRGGERRRPARLFVVGICGAVHGPAATQLVVSRRFTILA